MRFDEEKHKLHCESRNTSQENVIPCDICGSNVTFDAYDKHLEQHTTIHRQIEEEKALYTTIPCDICQIQIPFNKYESHIKTHESAPSPAVPPIVKSEVVPQEATIPAPPVFPNAQPSSPIVEPSVDPNLNPNPPLNPQPILDPPPPGTFWRYQLEVKEEVPKLLCEICAQETTPEDYAVHLISSHPEIFVPNAKGFLSWEIIENENIVVCETCNAHVDFNDLEAHFSTHNTEKGGDPSFYVAPKNEEQLTRGPYVDKCPETECGICQVCYNMDDTLVYLWCTHYYHEKCILEWINKQQVHSKKPVCPHCYKNVFGNN